MLHVDLSNDIALITGCTGGIGQASAHALAALNCSIAVHYHSAASTADDLVKALTSKNPNIRAHAFQADLSSYADTRRLHAEVVEQLGHPTILFNNAGTSNGVSGVTKADEVSIECFEQTWRANCGSAYLLTQLCLPAMEKAGWGRVVFCSSVAGFTGGIVGPHYASSKSALHGLIHWLASRYATTGITINGIAPALISETKMLPGQNEELAKKIPIGRLGTPDEIAETLVWMVKTGYVTNKVIAVDGGMFVQ